jgi:hypothetical protein
MTSGSVKGIEIHDRREKDGISHTNKDIDWTRTALNYDVHPVQNSNYNKAVRDRISALNLPKAVRKDAVVMAQVLVTSDSGFFDDMSKERRDQLFQGQLRFSLWTVRERERRFGDGSSRRAHPAHALQFCSRHLRWAAVC